MINQGASRLRRCLAVALRRRYAAKIRPYVDISYYRSQLPDLSSARIDCAQHYLAHGAALGLAPSPFFSPRFYLTANKDVAQSRMDPFTHFVRHGIDEGRSPHPEIDLKWAATRFGCTPREAYQSIATNGEIDPNPLFNGRWYRAHYKIPAGLSPLGHYLAREQKSGVRTSPKFDAEWFEKTAIGKECTDSAGPVHALLNAKHPALTPDLRHKIHNSGVRKPADLSALIRDGLAVDYDSLPRAIKSEIDERANQSQITFSIIIPTWNRRDRLARALQSVLAQTYKHYEIIVVDDGSTDGTAEMLHSRFADELASGTIKYISSSHTGASGARNLGLHEAQGDFIAYLDSDNLWRRNHLRCLASSIHSFPDTEVLYTPIFVSDDSSGESFTLASEFDRRRLLQANYIDLNGFAHSRAKYLRCGGFDTTLTRLIDWDLAIRMTADEDPLFVPIISTDYSRNAKDIIQISSSAPLAENWTVIQKSHLREMVVMGAISVDNAKHHLLYNKATLKHPIEEKPRLAVVLDSLDAAAADALRGALRIPIDFFFVAGGRLYSFDAPDTPVRVHEVAANVFYWPTNIGALSPASIYSAFLALVFGNHDITLISRSREPLPAVGISRLRDQMIFSRRVARSWLTRMTLPSTLSGRVLQFETLEGMSTRPLNELLEGNFALDQERRGFWTAGTKVAHFPFMAFEWAATPFPTLDKPALLAVPMKFAVGGVEWITLHVADAVSRDYSVVALAMEPLSPGQVPMDAAFTQRCAVVIPGYECIKPQDRLKLLTFLQKQARPKVIWFTNGSVWLRENAKEVRRIFPDAGIVDQQAYDTTVGWIKSYSNEGVRSFDRFVAVTRAIETTMIEGYGIDASRVDRIHHAIDVRRSVDRQITLGKSAARRELGLPADATIIGFTGRMVEQKNPKRFVELAIARRTKLDEHFVMVGDGALRAECQALAREKGLSNILFIPNVENIADVFSAIDLLVITSAYEGLPLVLIESICLGVPVVATDVGDIRNTLEEFSAGVTLRDDATATDFSSAIDGVLAANKSDAAAPIMVEQARQHFSVERVSQLYKASWEKAAEQRQAHGE